MCGCQKRMPSFHYQLLNSADCSAYTINAGAAITVGTDALTGKGTADISLSLGSYTASDITTNSTRCTFKAGTTWACSGLDTGDTSVTFAANKAGEQGWPEVGAANACGI
jgi:hypothetical protein